MDLVIQRHLLNVPEAISPITTQRNFETTHPSSTSFPLIAILVIGMMVSTFFLIGYYMLIIKCCLSWHHVDHLRRFSLSRHREDPSTSYSTASEPRGLEEEVIRLIPVIQYKPEQVYSDFGEKSFISECAVCLSEFQQDEKLRVIPNCGHVFHIDCIDIWLHNSAHCPLCRRIVSLTSQVNVDQLKLVTPRGQSQNIETHLNGVDEGFTVIHLDDENDRDQNLRGRQEEIQTGPINSFSSQRKLLDQNIAWKLLKVTSLGDECIGIRAKSERFSVQAMKRSFSMDSSVNRQLHRGIQQALQENENFHDEVSRLEVCAGSGKVKRSFFSFGQADQEV